MFSQNADELCSAIIAVVVYVPGCKIIAFAIIWWQVPVELVLNRQRKINEVQRKNKKLNSVIFTNEVLCL